MKKTLQNTNARTLRKELADCNLNDKAEIIVKVHGFAIKVDAVEVDEGYHSAHGNNNEGGVIITLNDEVFMQYVKQAAKKALSALIQ
jgi:hypothetical protein